MTMIFAAESEEIRDTVLHACRAVWPSLTIEPGTNCTADRYTIEADVDKDALWVELTRYAQGYGDCAARLA